MPTRDRADFVLHSIELLRRQDHDCWELMIVDDGSDGLTLACPPTHGFATCARSRGSRSAPSAIAP